MQEVKVIEPGDPADAEAAEKAVFNLRERHFEEDLFTALAAPAAFALYFEGGREQALQGLRDPVIKQHSGNY